MKKIIYTSLFATLILTSVSVGTDTIFAEEIDALTETGIIENTTTGTLPTNLNGSETDSENLDNKTKTNTETNKEVDTREEIIDDVDVKRLSDVQDFPLNKDDEEMTPMASMRSIPESPVEAPDSENQQKNYELKLVDSDASRETQELFLYLKEKMQSKDILFGQQHATDEGVTLTKDGRRVGSTDSEVFNSVGDYPAVFGWDTLSIDGFERPGVEGDIEVSKQNVIESIKTAHNLGAMIVLSMHPHNFVTGGSFNDTTGDVVNNILPGGDYNNNFNQWLDNIADVANNLVDDQGNTIPLIFRPFHEQNGGWFWWGANTTNTEQYKSLYKYTVEYLRDRKNIHNILYVYSPNSSIQGDVETYLKTYPGDNYVDILGIDSYDNKQNAGSDTFLNGLKKDLAMIVKLAEEKGKVAALTEFGYSPQGINATGNTIDWYTRLFNAIQSDKEASKIAYMLTWANFGLPNNMFVPYRDINGDLGGDHELLEDFENFYKLSNSLFRGEVGQIYGKDYDIKLVTNENSRYVIRPTERQVITTENGKINIKGLRLCY